MKRFAFTVALVVISSLLLGGSILSSETENGLDEDSIYVSLSETIDDMISIRLDRLQRQD